MKKISLEHSIRNIVNESVGNINDLKTSKPPKMVFNKPVHIEPPAGEEHGSMHALTVSNQRKSAKQNDSLTRNTVSEQGLFYGLELRGPNSGVQGPGGPNPGQYPGTRTPNTTRVNPIDALKDIESKKTPTQTSNTTPAPANTAPQSNQNTDPSRQTRIPGSSNTLPIDSFRESYVGLEHSIRNIITKTVIEAARVPDIRVPDIKAPRAPEGKGKAGEGRGDEGRSGDSGDFSAGDYGKFEKPQEPPKPQENQPRADEPQQKPKDDGKPRDDESRPRDDESRPRDDEGKPKDDEGKPKDDEGKPKDDDGKPKTDEGKPKTDRSADLKSAAAASLLGGGNSITPGSGSAGAGGAGTTSVGTHLHTARSRMTHADDFIHNKSIAKQITKRIVAAEETNMENGEERKKIEYVARGKLDPKKTLGRLSAIKTRIIDEAEEIKPSKAGKIKSIVLDKKEEKLGINPVVETEPRLKPLHMAEADNSDSKIPFVKDLANTTTQGVLSTRDYIEKTGKEVLPPEAQQTVRDIGSNVNRAMDTTEKKLTKVAEPVQTATQYMINQPIRSLAANDQITVTGSDPESTSHKQRELAGYGVALGGAGAQTTGTVLKKTLGDPNKGPNVLQRGGSSAAKIGLTGTAINSLVQDPKKNETEGGQSMGVNTALAADAWIPHDVGEKIPEKGATAGQIAKSKIMRGVNIARPVVAAGMLAHALMPKPSSADSSEPPKPRTRLQGVSREMDPAPYSKVPK